VKKADAANAQMTVSEFLREVRRLVVDYVVGHVLPHDGDAEATTGLDDVTTYYLLHRKDFGLDEAPIGACILYALSCNLSDSDLADRFDLLARSDRTLLDALDDEDDGEPDEEDAEADDPTHSLRDLAKDVVLRLAGRNTKAIRQLQLTYGGGKTHTLITLRHLVHDPASLPRIPAIATFESHIGVPLPTARVAALSFDKIDVDKGLEVRGPDGKLRWLKHPWSILAFQLAGADGLKSLHAQGKDAERDTPPAEPLLAALLRKPQAEGLATLVLIDEVLMYARQKVAMDGAWRGHLSNFFQYLCQAVAKVDRCALVASLLAADTKANDPLGRELFAHISEIFGRQQEEGVQPVKKEDVAEVLRRRFFDPASIADPEAFRPHVITAVANIAELDETVRKDRKNAEERFLRSYPFHPDLIDIFYSRWTQLGSFQRTRGILRTFAIALRDAEKWDTSPLVGPNVFLPPQQGGGIAAKPGRSSQPSTSGMKSTRSRSRWVPIPCSPLSRPTRDRASRTRRSTPRPCFRAARTTSGALTSRHAA
jgi:hypothetical protein